MFTSRQCWERAEAPAASANSSSCKAVRGSTRCCASVASHKRCRLGTVLPLEALQAICSSALNPQLRIGVANCWLKGQQCLCHDHKCKDTVRGTHVHQRIACCHVSIKP